MKYKSKPFEVEAVLFNGENYKELNEFIGGREHFYRLQEHDHVDDERIIAEVYDYLHDTWVGVKAGDYVIRGSKGEFYPCDPGVFHAKYEPVDD
jgi:hypothetical protein